jgi:hypothetical protein
MADGIAYLLRIKIPGIDGSFRAEGRRSAREAWDDYRALRDGYKFSVSVSQRKGRFSKEISEKELERLANSEPEI